MTHSNVVQVNLIELENLLPVIQSQTIFPYDYLRNIEKEKFVDYVSYEVQNLLNKGSINFIFVDNDNVLGILILHLLKWDTQIFGIRCARIKFLLAIESERSYEIKFALVSQAIEWAEANNIQFIDIHISPLDLDGINAIADNHFHLIATHIHHVWDFRSNFSLEREPQINIRIAKPDDLPQLEALAENFIPKHNRFFMDKKIRNTKKVPVMFREWLKNSLLGRAECFLVAEIENQIVGYTTIVVDRSTKETLGITIGDVELTGVVPGKQNRNVYLDMITFAVHWAQKNKLDIMEGVIHISNAPANVVPPRLNARVLGAHHTFHWHAE